ncbi:oxygenase MpaB family protein [Streptomyces eurythermus]|uniref:oxygenase MpaB family protein n=1 Tax=Streptomyces eurythermus TaxID=42237 RepID=UPI0036D34272
MVDISPSRRRLARLARIERLDPVHDHGEIYRISTGLEFPWEYLRALELANLRTFAAPSVSGLLAATGQYARASRRRYESTLVLMGALGNYGYDSPLGRDALRLINRMHRWYRISQPDLLYTLVSFVLRPFAFLDAYGWRPLSASERQAAFLHYRHIGRRIGIRDIPDDIAGMEAFAEDYERRCFRRHPANHAVAEQAMSVFYDRLPRPARPAARQLVISLLDDRARDALGYDAPARSVRRAAHDALLLRRQVQRRLPPRRRSYYDHPPRLHAYPGDLHDYVLADFAVPHPTPVPPPWQKAAPGRP